MTWLLIKIAIRFVVFGGVFWFATRKNEKIVITPKWALPLVALVYSALNIGLYWLAQPVINLATFGALALAIPLLLNGAFLYATDRVVKQLEIKGLWTMLWLSLVLTGAHLVLYVGLDWIPARVG
jgi:uncharacterized membrane protein YvlD (DUF360 family)